MPRAAPPAIERVPEPRIDEPSAGRVMLWSFAIGTVAALLYMLNAFSAVWRTGIDHPTVEIVTRLFALFWSWAALAPLVWWAARRWPIAAPNLAGRVALHLGLATLVWIAHGLIYWGALHLRAALDIAPVMLGIRWPAPHLGQIAVLADTDLIIYGVIVAAATIWRNHALAVASRTWRDRVDGRRSSALLEALRRQLRPHFVLNALNVALSELVHRPARARKLLVDLAAVLESTERMDGHLVDLHEELRIVRAHADIEQARFSDRLRVDWLVDVPAGSIQVPPFAVQTLFENAVRHGLEPSRGSFTIAVEASADGAGARVRVSDSGGRIGANGTGGAGIALDNLRTRLALLFGERAALSLKVEGRWTVAELCVPGAAA